MGALRTFRGAVRIGLGDLRVVYTPVAWTLGWCGRGIAQVLFFGYVGVLSGIEGQGSYMAVGNAVLLLGISGMLGVASTGWERSEGTLPFLVVGGGPVLSGLLGRSLQHLLAGYPAAAAAACVAFVVLPPGPLSPSGLVLGAVLLLAVGVSCMSLAMVLGALLLRLKTGRNLVSNVSYTLLMVLCGVNFPVDRLPDWLQAVAAVLPVTHGLAAFRVAVLEGAGQGVAQGLGLELLVAGGWLLVAAGILHLSVERARSRGALDWMY